METLKATDRMEIAMIVREKERLALKAIRRAMNRDNTNWYMLAK
jgi:hypothetical protein